MDKEKQLKEEEVEKVNSGYSGGEYRPKQFADRLARPLADRLASDLALADDKLKKVSGGSDDGNDGDEGFPCPCGGTFYVLSDYGRSICYKCNRCGKTLVQGC